MMAGERALCSARGVMRVRPDQGAHQAVQVSNSGSTDLQALVMFVVDAAQPLSAPAAMP